jgi:hypothetical protein
VPDNRRSSTRHDVDIAGRVKIGAETENCRVGNLSNGGAYIVLRRLPMGERVTLWFRIPTHDAEIEASGTVRWATDQGIGIQFDGLRARETWALGKFFESLQSS